MITLYEEMQKENEEFFCKDEWIKQQANEWEMIGHRLRKMRKQRGISMKAIADLLRVSETRISKLEHGQPIREALLLQSAYLLALGYLAKN